MTRTGPRHLTAVRKVPHLERSAPSLLLRITFVALCTQVVLLTPAALFLPVALLAPVALAQGQEDTEQPRDTEQAQDKAQLHDTEQPQDTNQREGVEQEDSDDSEEDEVAGELDDLLGVAAFGVSAGFPAYQTAALNASIQVEYVGMSLRTTWTPAAGLYGALALRGYPPVPGSPVPMFLEVGAGVHAGGAVPFAAFGAHVPLAQRIRLDIELGAARVPLIDQYNTAPFVSLGLSYAFGFDVAQAFSGSVSGSAGRRAGSGGAGATDCGLPPDASELRGAVSSTVSQFLRDARASYGSLYRRLRYSYRISDREISGDSASVSVDYEGSVIEIASGETISASGTASVDFTWNGCSWSRTGISY